MSTDFKNFETSFFENIKIKGMYELQIKPLELIVNISFSVIPTTFSLNENSANFHIELKRVLSLFAIDKAIKTLQFNWQYDGSRYTYGHDYSQVRLKNCVSSLGIDLYFIQTDETENIEAFYKTISQKIAELDVFKSSKYFVIRPNRKNNAKNQYQQLTHAKCN